MAGINVGGSGKSGKGTGRAPSPLGTFATHYGKVAGGRSCYSPTGAMKDTGEGDFNTTFHILHLTKFEGQERYIDRRRRSGFTAQGVKVRRL